MRGTGLCERLSCPYSHDPQVVRAANQEKAGRPKAAPNNHANGGGKGKNNPEKGKGDGKEKGKGDGKRATRPTGRSEELCRAYAAGTCTRGDRCGFSHDDTKMRSLVAALTSNPNVVGAQSATAIEQPPTKAHQAAALAAGLPPGFTWVRPNVAAAIFPTGSVMPSLASVNVPSEGRLTSLEDLPPSAWDVGSSPPSGYQCKARVELVRQPIEA